MNKQDFTPSALSDKIKEFLTQFKDSNKKYKYVDLIDSSGTKQSILINTKDIVQSDLKCSLEIYNVLSSDPHAFVDAVKRAVKEIWNEKNHQPKKFDVHVDEVERKPTIIEVLGNQYINDIVTITGMVTSKTNIYNIPVHQIFRCESGHEVEKINKTNFLQSPLTHCPKTKCNSRDLEDITPKENFERHRVIYVKSDEDFSFQNDEIEVDLFGDLTDAVEAGDRVQITGIVKTIPRKQNYLNIISCLYIKKLDDVDLTVLPEDEECFGRLPEEHDFYQRMIFSISPSTLGWHHVKESLLLQRIGAPTRHKDDGTRVRGWFNVGLFGSGGVAKTKLCEWEEQNLPRTQIVMSKGATEKGLTLGLEDDVHGRKVLRAGAFVNCRDGGIVVLEEFPRLASEVIDGLYTVLESGVASISKAGHQAKVRADAGLLANGNAYNDEWEESLNMKENLNLPVPLLQRFDYIWIMLDHPNEKRDAEIADAILGDVKYSESSNPHSPITLAKYIKFVKKFKPELTPEVNEHLKSTYLQIRQADNSKDNAVSPRHLNTIIRTTLAIARLYQRQYATIEDADKAISLMKSMLAQRNISISEADTYVSRQYKRCITILKEESIHGINTHDLFDKLLSFGSAEQITESLGDLGRNGNTRENWKWREVVEKLKRSPVVVIVNEKPVVLAYAHSKGDISKWT